MGQSAGKNLVKGVGGLLNVGAEDYDVGTAFEDLFYAGLAIVPRGGQGKKTIKAVQLASSGYAENSKGNITYAVRDGLAGAIDILGALTMGASSGTAGGRAYADSGYKSLTKTESAAMRNLMDTGMTAEQAFNAVSGGMGSGEVRNTADMPEWAMSKKDEPWMQAVIDSGNTNAYPREAPSSINSYDLSDEEKAAFNKVYALQYARLVKKAVDSGGDLVAASEKAFELAKNDFKTHHGL